jgi:O-methyltransferase involved in polyketide biosynthesis
MDKLPADSLAGVSETLLIPLHYRAETSKAGDSAFKDAMAERFHDTIEYDWSRFQSRLSQRPAVAARTNILDKHVSEFIARQPLGLIVNLGCGLDTRFHRLDNGGIVWIEMDLPEVIAFRRKLDEPPCARHLLLAGSILEERWVDEIDPYAGKPILLVAEGLFSYFTEEQHQFIFGYLARRFPGQEMLFQTSAPSVARGLAPSSDLSKLRTAAAVQWQWGLEESSQVSALEPRVRFVDEFPLLLGLERELSQELRQPLSAEQLRKAAKIVHVMFD